MFKKIVSCALVCSLIVLSFCSCSKQKERFTETYLDYFDTASIIVGFEYDEDAFKENCEFVRKQLEEYNKLYDIYKSYDGVNNIRTINENAGKQPIKVDAKIIDLLEYCKSIYGITGGMVNVAMGSVLSIWHNYREIGMNNPDAAQVPSMDELKTASAYTDIDKVIIDKENSTVYLEEPEMSLDVGAIAKGYATEQIARSLKDKGVTAYTLNFGGNIRTIGNKGDDTPWTAAVTDPDPNSETGSVMKVKLTDQVFVTSGSYQRFYTVDGVRYHHIVDPKSLMPLNTFTSVSVVCQDSGLADALSTALFNISLEDGKSLINHLTDVEAMWITADNEIFYTDGFKNIIVEE